MRTTTPSIETQRLIKIIQGAAQSTDAIIVEPVGTEMIQVARAAVAAGIGWSILNREPDYISELRKSSEGACLFRRLRSGGGGKNSGQTICGPGAAG